MTTPTGTYKPVDKGVNPYDTPFSGNRQDEKIQDLTGCISAVWHAVFCCCMPFTCCCNIKIVKPMHDTIVTQYGIPTRILRQTGPHCVGFCGTETEDIYVGLQNFEIKKMIAADDHGSPIVVTAQYVFRIQDSRAAAFRTSNLNNYIYEQAESALRNVAGMYPYDIDRHDEEHLPVKKVKKEQEETSLLENDEIENLPLTTPCLSRHSSVIDKQLIKVLQEMVNFVGVKIESFRIVSVGYPENMQKLLLAKSEAQAQVTARRTIAEGTSGIIRETLQRLDKMGIKLSEADKNRLAQNLTLLMVNHGHTTINIFDGSTTKT